MVLGYGCAMPSKVTHSKYPQDTYQPGKSL